MAIGHDGIQPPFCYHRKQGHIAVCRRDRLACEAALRKHCVQYAPVLHALMQQESVVGINLTVQFDQ